MVKVGVSGNTEGSPWRLVKDFEKELQEHGEPIMFDASMGKELRYAKRLLAACKLDYSEAVAIIKTYCKDEWEREHNPTLSRVVDRIDQLRSQMIKEQGRLKRRIPNGITRL